MAARTRAELEKELTDAARRVAPFAASGRRILTSDESAKLFEAAALMHRREQEAAAEAGNPEPPWLSVARRLIGTREIPGPKHSGLIASGWARLGAPWYNDDETPWCGFFVGHCLDAAGIAIPRGGQFARAKAWLDWGQACLPAVGAIAVFGRDGGGHVGFLVGESAANLHVLGGNQSNSVNVAPIAKARLLGVRWPANRAAGTRKLPEMAGGAVSRNES